MYVKSGTENCLDSNKQWCIFRQ